MPPRKKLGYKDEKIAQAFSNPADFGEIQLGYKFSDKQREALEACQEEGSYVAVSAANGGGKTSRLIPTLVLWHQTMFPAGKVKVTSGSYTQIEDQVWPAICQHKDLFPKWKWLETPYFASQGSTGRKGFCNCFTTNHPGKAEGDHEDHMDETNPDNVSPLLYIVDEMKTAPLWLKGVIMTRVRPTRLLVCSSMGFSEGWFYECCTTLSEKMGGRFKYVKITADDCPWISKEEIAQIKHDWLGQPAFSDSVLGYEFMPLVENAIINGRALDDNLSNPPKFKDGEMHLFCDFAWSGSGDENVLAMRKGNKVTLEDTFHADNLHAICDRFVANFIRLGVERFNCSALVSGDEGGGGKLILDEMDSRGWSISRINNGAPANDSDHYADTASEIWFEGGKAVTAKFYQLPTDQMARGQLLNRKQVPNPKGKLQAESKVDMRKRGVPSPDRADAILGAMMPGGGYGATGIRWAMPMGVARIPASSL